MDALFIFTRFPQAGCTKTRLIPALGEQGAADLQRQMTEYLLSQLVRISIHRSLSLQVHFTGGTIEQMERWVGKRFLLVTQAQGSLGDRLIAAFQQGFDSGFNKIIVIGSDCPEIGKENIAAAIALLETHDVVLGPAVDGGYYLIGLNQPCPYLFENVPWGTQRVLAVTEAIALKYNLSIALLETLSDIDMPEDLPIWHALKSA